MNVLDYAPRESRGTRVRNRWYALARSLRWFAAERPLRSAEVALIGWALFAITYILLVTGVARRDALLKPALASMLTASVVMLIAAVRLIRTRQYAASFLVAGVACFTALLGGVIQWERCPHATYVQVIGISIPVSGDPCNNPRNVIPWWAR